MRSVLILFLLWFSIIANAAEVNCFSNKTRIYHGYGKDFIFDDYFIAFTEMKTNLLIIISAECLINVPIDKGEKFNATHLRKESKIA